MHLQQKREQALTDAMTKTESMDVNDVSSLASFELANLGASRKRPVALNDDIVPWLSWRKTTRSCELQRRSRKPSGSPGRSNSASKTPLGNREKQEQRRHQMAIARASRKDKRTSLQGSRFLGGCRKAPYCVAQTLRKEFRPLLHSLC